MHLMSAASCSVEGIGVWGGRNFESGGGALALDVFWEAYYTLVFHSPVRFVINGKKRTFCIHQKLLEFRGLPALDI